MRSKICDRSEVTASRVSAGIVLSKEKLERSLDEVGERISAALREEGQRRRALALADAN